MYNQLFYDLITADDMGIHKHPQEQMKILGYEVLDAVPQSLYDGWWFTVKEFIEPLPKYLSKITYNFDYWHNDCWKDCKYFNMAKGTGPLCCYGGHSCIKNMSDEEINKRIAQHNENIDFHKKYKIDKIVSMELVLEDGTSIHMKN